MFGFGSRCRVVWGPFASGMEVSLKVVFFAWYAVLLSVCCAAVSCKLLLPFNRKFMLVNPKYVTHDPQLFFRAARVTTWYLWFVGQQPAPSKCFLASARQALRTEMRDLIISDDGGKWSVKLDVRDLGGHLACHRPTPAGIHTCRFKREKWDWCVMSLILQLGTELRFP